MVADTRELNRQRQPFAEQREIWLFGYGSLTFKVDFPCLQRRPAWIDGWVRRFWQGSHDHRGTPGRPGRVATLVEAPGARCCGVAYRVSTEVFDHLDYREKNGYLRFHTELHFLDAPAARAESAEGLVYIATADNAAYLGPAPEAEIARHIAAARGPSGSNRDYLLDLAAALRELGEEDEHVFAIERHLLSS